MEFFKTYSEDMHHDVNLLQTIRIPKNLLFLTDRLPQANYEKSGKKKEHTSSVDVNMKKKRMPELQAKDKENKDLNQDSVNKETIGKSSIEVFENDEAKLKKDKSSEALLSHAHKDSVHESKEKKLLKDEKKRGSQKPYQSSQINSGSQDVLPSINRVNSNNPASEIKG